MLGQVQSVASIGAEDHIGGSEGFARSHRNGLLANGQMHRTLDLVRRVDLGNLLFHPADPEERSIEHFVHGFVPLFHQDDKGTPVGEARDKRSLRYQA